MWLAHNDSVQGCTTCSWSKRTVSIVFFYLDTSRTHEYVTVQKNKAMRSFSGEVKPSPFFLKKCCTLLVCIVSSKENKIFSFDV
jgi:hypothetical protein